MCQEQVHKQTHRADTAFRLPLTFSLSPKQPDSTQISSSLAHLIQPYATPHQPQPSCHPPARTSASTSSRSSSRLLVSPSSADVALICSSTSAYRCSPGFLVLSMLGKVASNAPVCEPETDDRVQVDHQQVRKARSSPRRLGEYRLQNGATAI